MPRIQSHDAHDFVYGGFMANNFTLAVAYYFFRHEVLRFGVVAPQTTHEATLKKYHRTHARTVV
jgi:hypothetical protein